jgi:hypothetical protein
MFPFFFFAAFLIGLAKLSQPAQAKALPPGKMMVTTPREERLLTLLVLYNRDQGLPRDVKKQGRAHLSRGMAVEAFKLAQEMGMPRTAAAIHRDQPLPKDESFPHQGLTVVDAVSVYAKAWRL